jgi:hypothetical protein
MSTQKLIDEYINNYLFQDYVFLSYWSSSGGMLFVSRDDDENDGNILWNR